MTARARSLLTTPPARAWSQGRDVLGPELLPQPETGLPAPGTPHAPRPTACLGFPPLHQGTQDQSCNPSHAQISAGRLPSFSRLPDPTCAVAPAVGPSAWGTHALHCAAGCARGGGARGPREAVGNPARGRAKGRLLPPGQDRRFLSSLGPLHARAPPLAAPRPQGSESFAFHLGETKRGSAMGQGGQGPKGKTGRALTRPWK